MHSAIYWFGFLGSWLLVSGPVFQASVELRAEEEAGDRFHTTRSAFASPPPVSPWWWLLPPVRLVLSSRRSNAVKREFVETLSAEDLELVTRYANIARGWLLVGAGAFLIALKETYELAEHYEWPLVLYWLLVVLMVLVVLGGTASTIARQARSRPPGAP